MSNNTSYSNLETTIDMTSSIDLPLIVVPVTWPAPSQTEPISTSAAAAASITTTTTVTPPLYPWSQTSKNSEPNSKPTAWHPASASPRCSNTASSGGHKCRVWCEGPCFGCHPFGGTSGGRGGGKGKGGGGGGKDGDKSSSECSTETATICSTACIASQTCGFDLHNHKRMRG